MTTISFSEASQSRSASAVNPAVLYSIIGTCKLLKVNRWAYFNWALPGLAAATNMTASNFTPQRFLAR